MKTPLTLNIKIQRNLHSRCKYYFSLLPIHLSDKHIAYKLVLPSAGYSLTQSPGDCSVIFRDTGITEELYHSPSESEPNTEHCTSLVIHLRYFVQWGDGNLRITEVVFGLRCLWNFP